MHPDPNVPGDLSDLEQRLSAWQPAVAGLDADAMLFAAGRAAARRRAGRFVWPAVACFTTALAVLLALRLDAVLAQRKELVEQLRRQSPAPASAVMPTLPESSVEEPVPDSFLATRRALDLGVDVWAPRSVAPAEQSGPNPPVLQVGHRDALLDP